MQSVPRKFYAHMVVLLVFALISTIQLAGQATPGRLHGNVADPSGAVIPKAKVSVKDQTGKVLTVASDEIGAYQFGDLPPGKYTLTSMAKGFAILTQEVEIPAGRDVNLKIVLKINPQQLEIVVQGKEGEEEGQGHGLGVGSDSNASAMVIKGKELDFFSDDPSEFGKELLELAGPSAGPNGGQIYVDGFTAGFLPPKISVREVRINQNPFAPESDKLSYGKIDVFTKPGSEQFHGQFDLSENNSVFSTANPYAGEKLAYNSEIYTANVFGPLTKKLTGYYSFQVRNINDTVPVNAVVLDNNLNQVPISQTLPHPDHVKVGGIRFDYQANPNHTIIARYLYTGIDTKNNGIAQFSLASQAADYRAYEQRVQISDNIRLTAQAETDVRFEFRRNFDGQTALSFAPEVEVTGAFAGGGNPVGRSFLNQQYYELQSNTLMTHGRHVIKFGGRLRTTTAQNNSTQGFNGSFLFNSLDAYQITLQGLQQGLTPAQIRAAGGGASQFLIQTGDPVTRNTSVDGAVYIQDEWRIRPNFNVGYGVRYEGQNVINDHFDLAPRVSFAWGIDGGKRRSPKTILRGGFGVFFDRFVPNLELVAKRLNGVTTQEIVISNPDFFPNVPPASALAGTISVPSGSPGVMPRELSAGGGELQPTVTRISSDFRAPYIMQTSLALEHQFGKNATFSATYLNSRGVHQLFSRNVNAPLPGTFIPGIPSSGIRPLGNTSNIYEYQSEGTLKQNQLITNLNVRIAAKMTFLVRHTLSYANSNTNTPGTFPSNQFDPAADFGRSAFDIRNRIFVGATFDLTHGFRLSPLLILNTGRPFDITIGQDLNGDSIFNDRPSFATDLSRPSVVVTRFGAFDTDPVAGQRIIPRNFGTGPLQYTFNLRAGKTFVLGEKNVSKNNPGAKPAPVPQHAWSPHYMMSFNLLAQNIFNHLNSGPPIGSLDSPLFGQSNTLSGPPFSSSSSTRRLVFQSSFTF